MSDLNKFLFRDNIALPAKGSLFTDSLSLFNDAKKNKDEVGVRVTIKATYSGYLLNNRVYPGTKMRQSASSWLSQEDGGSAGYSKPFLLHHDSHRDAVGRIDFQRFTPLKTGDEFKNDWKNPGIGTDNGSGFITLSGLITDPDAMVKVLDGRYKTVSTGQGSDSAICSICGEEWAGVGFWEDYPCEHRIGQVHKVDGKKYKMYLVTGKLDYYECSFVNTPANENASVIATDSNDFDLSSIFDKKSNERVITSVSNDSDILSIQLTDSAGCSTELIRKDGEEDTIPYGEGNIRKKILISVPPTNKLEIDHLSDESETATLPNGSEVTFKKDGTVSVASASDPESVSSEDSVSEMTDQEFALAHTAKSLQESGLLIQGDLDGDVCNITFDSCIEMIGKLKKTNLNEAQRKLLSTDLFCGPNDSFPVPDSAHVTAALRLIGRAKIGDSKKSDILSAINHRAKQLGCGGSVDNLNNQGAKQMADAPKKVSNDAPPADEVVEPSVLEKALEDAQAKAASLQSDLDKTKQLHDTKVTEHKALLDELAEVKGAFKRQTASQLVTVQMQMNKSTVKSVKDEASYNDMVDSLASRTIESLQDSVNDLIPELSESFKKGGLPGFIKDKAEGKPGVQSRKTSEHPSKTKSNEPEDATNLL